MSFARHGLAVFTWLFVPPPSPGTQSHSHSLAHAPLPANLHGSGRAAGWPRPPPRPASCPDEAAATGKRPRAALPGRRACRTRPGELGALRTARSASCRGWGGGCGPRGPGRTRPPGVAGLSPLLRVSAERRPQEAAPRKATADRRAQRQTSKRAGACAPKLRPRWGGGVARHFGSTLKSAGLGAARSDSQRSLSAALKVTRPLFSGKKEPGSWRPRGGEQGSGSGRKREAALKRRRAARRPF